MATVLLTWNPDITPDLDDAWEDVADDVNFWETEWTWSVGQRQHGIGPGDRAYLIRQGLRGRGLVMAGEVMSNPKPGKHYDKAKAKAGKTSMYVQVEWAGALERDNWISTELLKSLVPGIPWDQIYGSGFTNIDAGSEAALARVWQIAFDSQLGVSGAGAVKGGGDGSKPAVQGHPAAGAWRTPYEEGEFIEGGVTFVMVNRYERDPNARARCIDVHGAVCASCGFDFEAVYGKLGSGYIVVHHLVPLADLGGRGLVDPVKDMRPLCPNCHAMVHRSSPPMPLAQLKALLRCRAAAKNAP